MNAVDQFRNRVAESLILAVIAFIAAAFANAFARVTQPEQASVQFLLFGMSNLGILITLVGLVAATIRAGFIGSFGFLFELAGTANIQNGELNVGLLIVGAILVVFGGLVWSWSAFLNIFGSKSSGGFGR